MVSECVTTVSQLQPAKVQRQQKLHKITEGYRFMQTDLISHLCSSLVVANVVIPSRKSADAPQIS